MGLTSSIIFAILGILIFVLGFYNIIENSSFWFSMMFCIVGAIILIATIWTWQNDKPIEEIKNDKIV